MFNKLPEPQMRNTQNHITKTNQTTLDEILTKTNHIFSNCSIKFEKKIHTLLTPKSKFASHKTIRQIFIDIDLKEILTAQPNVFIVF